MHKWGWERVHEVLQLIQGWCRVNIIKGKVGGIPNGTRQCRYADWTKDSKASGIFSCYHRLGPPSPLVTHMSSILIHGTCVYRLSQCCNEILAKSDFKQGGLNFARSFIVYCGREVMAAGA